MFTATELTIITIKKIILFIVTTPIQIQLLYKFKYISTDDVCKM